MRPEILEINLKFSDDRNPLKKPETGDTWKIDTLGEKLYVGKVSENSVCFYIAGSSTYLNNENFLAYLLSVKGEFLGKSDAFVRY